MDFIADLFEKLLGFFLTTGDPEIDRRRRFLKFSVFGGMIVVALFVFYLVAQGAG